MRRREIYILSAILGCVLILGFVINFESFAENMLSSAADLIVGIFIAFYLIDRISRRERARKWEHVKILSYHSIEATCDLIMFTFMTESGVIWDTSPYAPETTTSPERKTLYENFLDLGEEISTRSDERSDSSYRLLAAVRPYFEKLSLSIFPRVLELDEQTELISSLIDVDSAYQEWDANVDTIEGDWGMPESFAWKAAAKFCTRIGEMLKITHLAQRDSGQTRHQDLSPTAPPSSDPWDVGSGDEPF